MVLRRAGFVIGLGYTWLSLILFGALANETVLLYPNIFHDVPRSLATAMDFLAVVTPGDVFPLLGGVTLLAGLLTITLTWPVRAARWWFLGAIVVVGLGDYLLSALYLWERNAIMAEGTAVHSAAYLQQVAAEFQTAHWLRVAAAGIAAALVFTGFLRLHRDLLAAKAGQHT